jgi:hypothetical protein
LADRQDSRSDPLINGRDECSPVPDFSKAHIGHIHVMMIAAYWLRANLFKLSGLRIEADSTLHQQGLFPLLPHAL